MWVRAGVLVPAHGLGPRAAVVSAQAPSLGGVAGVEAGAGAPLRRRGAAVRPPEELLGSHD